MQTYVNERNKLFIGVTMSDYTYKDILKSKGYSVMENESQIAVDCGKYELQIISFSNICATIY